MIYESLIYKSSGGSVEMKKGGLYSVNVSRDTTGLFEIETTTHTSTGMGQYGSTVTGIQVDEREIEIKGYIKCRDKEQDREARRFLAAVFNPTETGTLEYVLGEHRRTIRAKPDGSPKFAGAVFTEFSISLVCHNPFWTGQGDTQEKELVAWKGLWEFPGVIDEEEGMEFETRDPSLMITLENDGDAPTGIVLEFIANGEISNPSIICVETGEFIRIIHDMAAGDRIRVNTTYGEKGVFFVNAEGEEDIMPDMDIDSTYIQIPVGGCTFRYDADSGRDDLKIVVYSERRYIGA